ncbi:MAG: hypothetical protein HY513_03235 [Candidatus Aenigmarchaeota archaeon]|nr:hypothetical protein [Candidatus Aenigmarchaeota archaeon]
MTHKPKPRSYELLFMDCSPEAMRKRFEAYLVFVRNGSVGRYGADHYAERIFKEYFSGNRELSIQLGYARAEGKKNRMSPIIAPLQLNEEPNLPAASAKPEWPPRLDRNCMQDS